jgi:hypothetical protein
MIIDAPKKLPSRNLLPLATTVERVYSDTPTWLLAVGLAVLMAAVAAVGCTQQRDLDQHQCEATFGAGDARCAK